MPGVLSCNAILDAVIRCKKPVRFAEEVFEEMIRNGISPNVFTYNILIRGFLLGGEFGEDRMKETNEVLQEMSWEGFIPDEVTYDTLVNGHCKDGNLHQALVSHAEMVWNGLLQTSLRGLCEHSRLAEACHLFQEMPSAGVTRDGSAYTMLIYAYCREGDIKKAFHLHDEMVPEGLPSICYLLSVVALIKGFCMKGLMNEADRVFETMLQRNRNPDEAAYNVIIHGHRRGGNIQKAYDLYKW
ncbi:hypothetical protein V6N12_010988 [Hibiscus sabdariffa]|uniref:Pentatricopeptide repeat-containing protein n=1 Tax=Hibiscus sabdariffa TaxID=183260 RepID=A0ABR2ENG5_9ROSI